MVIGLIVAALTAHAAAAELELKDLPAVIGVIRECKALPPGMFGGRPAPSCRLSDSDVWAAVHADGITIYFEDRVAGIRYMSGSGKTVQAAVQDLANNLAKSRSAAKSALDALAPMLPTQ